MPKRRRKTLNRKRGMCLKCGKRGYTCKRLCSTCRHPPNQSQPRAQQQQEQEQVNRQNDQIAVQREEQQQQLLSENQPSTPAAPPQSGFAVQHRVVPSTPTAVPLNNAPDGTSNSNSSENIDYGNGFTLDDLEPNNRRNVQFDCYNLSLHLWDIAQRCRCGGT